MSIERELIRTQTVTEYQVSGVPDMQVPCGKAIIRPTTAKVIAVNGEVTSVTFAGPWVLKSGALGRNVSDIIFRVAARYGLPPVWLADFLAEVSK